MLQPKFMEDISKKIKELVSTSPAADMEKNLRAMLQSAFAKLDLVTREEFDAQTQVLLKAREQLDALAQKVSALENTKKPLAKPAAKPATKPRAKPKAA
ncbi:MAG: accessory factor UbiK family protein [Methylophilaceae bacterium]